MEDIIKILKKNGTIDRMQNAVNKAAYIGKDSDHDIAEGMKMCLAFECTNDEELLDAVLDYALGQIVKELNIKPDKDFKPDEDDKIGVLLFELLSKILK